MKQLVWVLVLSWGLWGCATPSQMTSKSATLPASTPVSLPETATPPQISTVTPQPSPTGTPKPSISSSVTATLTASPSITPTLAPTETATPTDLPQRVVLSPLNHQWQTLNNCHRASIATLMGYYGVWFSQHDYDVAMDNLQDFLSPYGLTARIYTIRYADVPMHDVVRWLLAENIPVIVGQNLSSDDHTWHYRVSYAYDDSSQEIISDDSLLGPDLHHTYEMFDRLSRTHGQVIPVYPLEMDDMIEATMRNWQMKLITYP